MKKISFEESLKRLEEITEKLESGELSLDDSLKYFEEGVKLSRFCENKLTETEQQVKILESTDIEDIEETDEQYNKSDKVKNKRKKKDDLDPGIQNEGEESFLF